MRIDVGLGRKTMALTLALAGCTATTEPLASTTIVGEFGGNQVRLEATATSARITFACAEISTTAPLVTDAAGRFSVAGGRRRTGGAIPVEPEPPTPVVVSGRAFTSNGGTLRLVVAPIPEEPGAPPSTADTLSLVRGREAMIYLCP